MCSAPPRHPPSLHPPRRRAGGSWGWEPSQAHGERHESLRVIRGRKGGVAILLGSHRLTPSQTGREKASRGWMAEEEDSSRKVMGEG